jgi:hypothetical protein
VTTMSHHELDPLGLLFALTVVLAYRRMRQR